MHSKARGFLSKCQTLRVRQTELTLACTGYGAQQPGQYGYPQGPSPGYQQQGASCQLAG